MIKVDSLYVSDVVRHKLKKKVTPKNFLSHKASNHKNLKL